MAHLEAAPELTKVLLLLQNKDMYIPININKLLVEAKDDILCLEDIANKLYKLENKNYLRDFTLALINRQYAISRIRLPTVEEKFISVADTEDGLVLLYDDKPWLLETEVVISTKCIHVLGLLLRLFTYLSSIKYKQRYIILRVDDLKIAANTYYVGCPTKVLALISIDIENYTIIPRVISYVVL